MKAYRLNVGPGNEYALAHILSPTYVWIVTAPNKEEAIEAAISHAATLDSSAIDVSYDTTRSWLDLNKDSEELTNEELILEAFNDGLTHTSGDPKVYYWKGDWTADIIVNVV